MENKPLVSILIPNRNYGRYLEQALDSAFNQTYKNIEVIFSDNCSTDNSLEVAMKYLDKGLLINKRPENTWLYYDTVFEMCKGKYFVLLCADDIIKPTFIEKAVEVMERHQNIGYVHCERDYIDENKNITELDYFFNCSFMAKGEYMLPIYTITDVGQAVQALIRRESFLLAGAYDTDSDYSCIDRELWFRLSMVSDYAYLREKLALYRVHSASSMNYFRDDLFSAVAMYNEVKSFIDWGKIKGYREVVEREEAAYKKLTDTFLYHINSCIKSNDINIARQYLLFIKMLNKDAISDKKIKIYDNICEKGFYSSETDTLPEDESNSFRVRNYAPPRNFVLLAGDN